MDASRLGSVPYALGSYVRGRDEETFAWPVRVHDVKLLNRALHAGLRNVAMGVDDPDPRAVFTVGAPPVLVTLLTLGTARLTVAAAQRQGMALDAEPGTIAAALHEGRMPDCAAFLDQVRRYTAHATRPNRMNLVRRVAHRLVTNRGPGLAGRSVTVLNHNTLLQSVARAASGRRFRYETSDRLLAGKTQEDPQPSAALTSMGSDVAEMFAGALEATDASVSEAFKSALAAAIVDWFATVAAQRRQVAANWRRPPLELWTGTGGNHVTRLASSRVREAGGQVVVHEHGGGGHIHRDLGALHLHEFSLCDRFIADTSEKAEVIASALDPDQLWTEPAPDVLGRPDGGHSFAWLGGARSREIRKVMYVTTAFVGEVQYPLQPLLADVVYADWQGRLLDGLARQGFEMLCKQHPEGILFGKSLELSRHAEYLDGRFLDIVDQADAFVFDYPATTALWEAVCTEKPVLFVDLGLADWRPDVWNSFRQRCAVVSAEFDERNRPVVDFEAAAEAIRAAPMDDSFASAYLTGTRR